MDQVLQRTAVLTNKSRLFVPGIGYVVHNTRGELPIVTKMAEIPDGTKVTAGIGEAQEVTISIPGSEKKFITQFRAWHAKGIDPAQSVPGGSTAGVDLTYKLDCNIVLISTDGSVTYEYRLSGAWCSNFTVPAYDSTGTESANWNITLQVDRIIPLN